MARLAVGITLAIASALLLPANVVGFACLSRNPRIKPIRRHEFVISTSRFTPYWTSTTQQSSISCAAKKTKNDDDDDEYPPGMAEAFRRLESLESLEDSSDGKNKRQSPKASPESMKQAAKAVEDSLASSSQQPVPLEKEAQMYQEMVKDLETMNEQDLYDSILTDLDDSDDGPAKSSNPAASSSSMPPSPVASSQDSLPKATGGINDELMNQAMQAAMSEIDKDYPALKDSILNDKELMKEIEAIFDRGNDKLMLSLEDIRKEQSDLARASATNKVQSELDSLDNDTLRLEQAEASISTMLKRVNSETAEIVAAVEDLKRAQTELDRDFLFRLKNGGVLKQSSLVGLVLFSIRSIVDSVASFQDESHLVPALAQGAIAILCAAYFFLV